MKQIAIGKMFTYFYTESKEIEGCALDDRLDNFRIEIRELLKKYDMELGESWTTFFGLEKFSITNCEKCDQLMMNRDKNPAGLNDSELNADINMVILDGGESDNKLLCEECLPFTHRWGHSS